MGKAREVMDRFTELLLQQRNIESAIEMYDDNAVLMTPDAGDVQGRANIADYWRIFIESYPDLRYESMNKFEAGSAAIDEGMVIGTNTAPLQLPTGEQMPATGEEIGVRSCDIVILADGQIAEHHLYFDQLDLFDQLGLTTVSEPEELEE